MKPNISVLYDYADDQLCPMWMLIKFDRGGFDWSEDKFYVSLEAPFERKMAEDFLEEQLSLTITSVDLTVNYDIPNSLGIDIFSVKKRINKIRGEQYAISFRLDDIEQFVIQIGDIEEIMAMSRFDLFAWR
jgi:hypothetical protein